MSKYYENVNVSRNIKTNCSIRAVIMFDLSNPCISTTSCINILKI